MIHEVGETGRRITFTALAISMAVACGGQMQNEPQTGEMSEALTATFRVGVAGYASADDVHITNQNGGNGVTDRTSTQLIAWKKTGTDAYEAESLIRFNNLSLSGVTVTSAQLTLSFENWWTGYTLRGYYLKSAWNAAPAAPLGWLNRDTSLTWNTPGAKGIGTDVQRRSRTRPGPARVRR
jgi:hypothetical protein